MKRKLQILKTMLFMLCFAAVLGMAGTNVQAATAKAQVKKSTNALMSAVKKTKTKTIDKYVLKFDEVEGQSIKKATDIDEMKVAAPSQYRYIKTNNARMTYKIKKITVKGKNATVKVGVRYVNSKDYTRSMVTEFEKDYYDKNSKFYEILAKAMLETDEKAQEAMVAAYVDDLYDRAGKSVTTVKFKRENIILKMTKKGKTWKVISADKNLQNLMTADAIKSGEEVNKDPDVQALTQKITEDIMAYYMSNMNFPDVKF